MSALLWLLIAASPPSTAFRPIPCADNRASCAEGCTLEFGSTPEGRDQVVACLTRCDERAEVCELRNQARRTIAERRQKSTEKAIDGADAGR